MKESPGGRNTDIPEDWYNCVVYGLTKDDLGVSNLLEYGLNGEYFESTKKWVLQRRPGAEPDIARLLNYIKRKHPMAVCDFS